MPTNGETPLKLTGKLILNASIQVVATDAVSAEHRHVHLFSSSRIGDAQIGDEVELVGGHEQVVGGWRWKGRVLRRAPQF
jgi:hypothetical protein